uniref:Uncharacterized protein n=1 Tax=Anguilla anguilla TaxID=7936 RepID=A0A0E9W2U2_ANGAN
MQYSVFLGNLLTVKTLLQYDLGETTSCHGELHFQEAGIQWKAPGIPDKLGLHELEKPQLEQ